MRNKKILEKVPSYKNSILISLYYAIFQWRNGRMSEASGFHAGGLGPPPRKKDRPRVPKPRPTFRVKPPRKLQLELEVRLRHDYGRNWIQGEKADIIFS